MQRRSFLVMLPGALGFAAPDAPLPNRAKVPGTLSLRARSRNEAGGQVRVSEKTLRWEVAQTAIIICDMWDTHTCDMSAQRVAAMAPRMNQVVSAARSLGVMIIHAPSDVMKYYEGTPHRLRMQQAAKASSPIAISNRCPRDTAEERSFPIDDTVSACDDPLPRKEKGPPWPWTRENPAIDIIGYDGVSADAQEIYNFCKQESITNVALMGVHTNICILNRGFGLRQMTQLGFHMALVRDLTDAMYDPRTRPFVSHTRGTELVIEHIEKRWAPSVLGEDLTRVVPGSDNPAKISSANRRP
jgi:nicotinamidase-related amidase